MIRRTLALVLMGTCGGGAVAAQPATDWRRVATERDRARLRDWREAWLAAAAKVRAGGGGAALLAKGKLLDPDAALADPLPPEGPYRCGVIKLGMRGSAIAALAEREPVECSVERVGEFLHFAMRGGAQRPTGELFADGRTRGVFLGTLVLGEERRPIAYGRDAGRDMAGLVERVGERRWRIVLPYPRFESTLDVIEMTPVAG